MSKQEPWISEKDLKTVITASILTIIPIIIFATLVLQKTNDLLYQPEVLIKRTPIVEINKDVNLK